MSDHEWTVADCAFDRCHRLGLPEKALWAVLQWLNAEVKKGKGWDQPVGDQEVLRRDVEVYVESYVALYFSMAAFTLAERELHERLGLTTDNETAEYL